MNSSKKTCSEKKKNLTKNIISLRGVIIPVDWDQKGNVIATAISTHNEEEYLIIDKIDPERINLLLNEEVEITGWVKKKGKKKMIEVITCKSVITEGSGNNN
ncbi:MAG: hypothetical protein N3A64_05210 [Desulfobacterota bacterium]|nr:hypothetical protein [Thermodesulfobacteriota bacterium]